ncbi:MAG TPA: sugar phosphate isomerase/epimerase family protein [Longimicrobiales bacterium]
MREPRSRRDFLAAAGGAIAGFSLLGTGCATASAAGSATARTANAGATTAAQRAMIDPRKGVPGLPYRISLAEWSLHRELGEKKLDNLDFARVAREDFDIDAIEYVNSFFKDKATDAAYLAELNRRAADYGVVQHLIMVDGEGRLGDPDQAARRTAVDNHRRWLHAAKELGCITIRVNAASEGSYEEQQKLAADGLRSLSELGDEAGINVIVENHGGLSSNGAWLSGVMKMVDHPRCGTLPDFGNFNISSTEKYDIYQGISELMPYAKAVSAKSHDFDDVTGGETTKDYRRIMKIVTDSGFHSWVGIEYEGSRLPEREGIRRTLALLKRVREEMS